MDVLFWVGRISSSESRTFYTGSKPPRLTISPPGARLAESEAGRQAGRQVGNIQDTQTHNIEIHIKS
jgi:hypothetical protein